MNFASDNAGPVHPKILEALARANEGYALPYGDDPFTRRAIEKVQSVFEAPDAKVFFLPTGAAANSLILASWATPWSTIFCGRYAHIHDGEGNAPEAMSGAKLVLVGSRDDKFSASELSAEIARWDPHHLNNPEPGPVSITQLTEWGTLYSSAEIREIADVTHSAGLKLHVDGARFANALSASAENAAEASWKSGVDALTFGGTKNGLMGVETAIFFDDEKSWEFQRRRKRAAHLLSKARYLAAQIEAYLTDNLWLELAAQANSAASKLAEGLGNISGAEIAFPTDGNMIFVWFPRHVHRRLKDEGVQYYIERGQLDGEDPDELLLARFVCDWSCTERSIAQFLKVANLSS